MEQFYCLLRQYKRLLRLGYGISARHWEYGVAVYSSPVECCGAYIVSYRPGGTCIMVELRSPAIQDRLAELAAASDLLVADCGGRYALYAPPAGDPKLARIPGLPSDRVLR